MKSWIFPAGYRRPLYGLLLGTACCSMSCASVAQQAQSTAASAPATSAPATSAPATFAPAQTAAKAADGTIADASQQTPGKSRVKSAQSKVQPASAEAPQTARRSATGTPPASSGDSQSVAGSSRSKAKSKADALPAVAVAAGTVKLASSQPADDEPVSPAQDGEPKDAPSADEVGDSGPQPDAKAKAVLKDTPLEDGDKTLPITLATAMKLSDARPLVIAAAQASAWVAEAQLQRAQVIWVPSLNFGSDYIRHDGYGPDFNRGVNTSARPLNQNINFLYSGTGLTMGFALTDAVYEPLAAKQVLKAKRFDIQAAKNDALLMTAKSYFDVHQYRGQYAGAVDVVDRGEQLLERISHLSEDLVPRVEADRAKRMLATAQQNAATARQQWRVSSANLTQALRLDPRVVVDPAEHDHVQITLIEPARTLDDLIPIGLTNRPELASKQAIVGAVAERIRREKGRILMPSIYLNGFQTPNELIEVGAQGIGNDRNLNLWSARDDFSPQVVWQFEGMGYGNLARIKEQRGEQSKAIVELFKEQDAVAADVTRAQARLQSAAVRVVEAERSMREAIITYEGNYEGLRQTKRFDNVLVQVYRPQEAVIALNDLMVSYNQYFATVADYNRAQFELYHALGYPAIDVTDFNTPGEAEPVDTSRPGYLPEVGEGPPPATR